MKFNFRKIATTIASTALVGSTVALAAAASYPVPFVEGGVANVAVVYGSNAAASPTDLVAATAIQTDLNAYVTDTDNGDTTITGGDFVQIQKDTTNKFNLGENITNIYSSIDETELSTLLAEGTYKNDNSNEEFDYSQKITFGDIELKHFLDTDYNNDEPIIGFDLPKGTFILNYTLDFDTAAEGYDSSGSAGNWDYFETTDWPLFGKTYYVLTASNSSGGSMTLLDAADTVNVAEGDTDTTVIGSTTYTSSISFINKDEVKLVINGETTDTMNEGETYKLADGAYVGVKHIMYSSKDTGVSSVEFSIGSGKIELNHNDEVKLNGDDISDNSDSKINAYFKTSSDGENVDSLTLQWIINEDTWMSKGSEITMPGFNAVKILMGDFVTDKSEVTKIHHNSDNTKLDTVLTDGSIDQEILQTNGTTFNVIGEDSSNRLITNSTSGSGINWNASSSAFVATWINNDDFESYLLEIETPDDSTPTKNTTVIKSLASGSTKSVSLDIGDTESIGEINFNLVSASEDDDSAYVIISSVGSGTVYADRLVTEEGLMVYLPTDCVAENTSCTEIGALNTSSDDTWTMQFAEEDEDNNVHDGGWFDLTVGIVSDKPSVTTVDEANYSGSENFETNDGSDNYIGYIASPLATEVLYKTGGDQDTVEITYHGSEAYGEVFVAESAADTGSTGNSLGVVTVTDAEASSMATKNLIVIGGSCINSLASSLLGSDTAAMCGPSFTAASGIDSGSFLIKSYTSPYSDSKIALLVAGYGAADTTNAATALTTQDIDTTVGKAYTGTSGTSVNLM